MKTSELTGFELDLAVAKAEGEKAELNHGEVVTWKTIGYHKYRLVWRPSTDWAQAGPIIEREGISIDQRDNGSLVLACIDAPMEHEENEIWVNGPTPLIAAMRCYVSSKLGDEIEIPEQLVEGV